MVTKPPTFSASDQRSRAVMDQIEKERTAADAKTARLKALRLAKEAEERAQAAAKSATKAAQNPAPKPRPKRVT